MGILRNSIIGSLLVLGSYIPTGNNYIYAQEKGVISEGNSQDKPKRLEDRVIDFVSKNVVDTYLKDRSEKERKLARIAVKAIIDQDNIIKHTDEALLIATKGTEYEKDYNDIRKQYLAVMKEGTQWIKEDIRDHIINEWSKSRGDSNHKCDSCARLNIFLQQYTLAQNKPVDNLRLSLSRANLDDKVIFVKEKTVRLGYEYTIWIMDPDGKNQRQLSPERESCPSYKFPVWSPDKKLIAFTSLTQDLSSDISVIGADGENVKRLTDEKGYETDLAWSPDGRKIAFSSDGGKYDDIYVIDVNDGKIKRLTDTSKNFSPTWSPDSKRIAFTSFRDGNSEIYVMDAHNGKSITRLTNNKYEDIIPDWSPDGTKILFCSNKDSSSREIYTMNPDGSNVEKITRPKSHKDIWYNYAKWDSYGLRIVIEASTGKSNMIYVMDLKGKMIGEAIPSSKFESYESPDW